VQRLRALGPEEAHVQLQSLPGIGQFYASLIVLRAVGVADVPVTVEPLALELMGRLYDFGRPATPAEAEQVGLPWRPWRTWTTVLLRAAGPELASAQEPPVTEVTR
jgi:DNA-3-methyladenine glycosylase II